MKRMIAAGVLLTGMSATWAAGGWYLITPPWSDFDASAPSLSRYKMLDDKPLSEWKREGAFDSASDCEAARTSMLGNLQRNFDSSYAASKEYAQAKDVQALQLANLAMMSEASHASVMAYTAGRCVRSDDQRLSGSPVPAR
ncbi:MAG TPA: hypothetical protein VEF92_03215 [Burkholderiales bacterium]|nr:hypothetical protein [Burkholderiales bacterium]HYA46540.1 hypothetical protein [Burkholderiales bacterium]